MFALAAALLLLALAAGADEDVPEGLTAAADETATSRPKTATAGPAPNPEEEEQQRAWEIEGYLQLRLRVRNVDSDTDADLYLDVVADAVYRGQKTIRARVNGRLVADIGGDDGPADPLYDVWDTFDHDVQFRLYEGYGEIEGLLDGLVTVRAGRQFVDEGVYLHFDGGQATLSLDKVLKGADLSVFFGVPVRFGETSRSDNWLAGAVFRAQIDKKTRCRVEYYHISEFFEGINNVLVDPLQQPVVIPAQHLDDDFVGFSLWRRFLDTLRFFGRFTLLNGDANELHLRLRWFTKDGKWTVLGEIYELFGRLDNVTNDLTPYVPMLSSYEPFIRLTVRVTRRFGEEWIVQGGYSRRELEDGNDEGQFNHEYNNFYFTATRLNLLDEKLDVTVTLNGYASDLNDVVTAGGHAVYRVAREWEVSGGVDYALYKYDWFQDTEREDVWSYTLEVRWERDEWRVTGGVSVDDDNFDTWTTFYVRVRMRF